MGWSTSHTIRISTPPQNIFGILQNVREWHVWDVDCKQASLEPSSSSGSDAPTPPPPSSADSTSLPPLFVGQKGKLEMVFNQTFSFTFTSLTPFTLVEYQTPLPGATETFWYWKLKDLQKKEGGGGGTELEMGCRSSGYLSWMYGLALKSQCKVAFEKCCQNMKELAEEGVVKSFPKVPASGGEEKK